MVATPHITLPVYLAVIYNATGCFQLSGIVIVARPVLIDKQARRPCLTDSTEGPLQRFGTGEDDEQHGHIILCGIFYFFHFSRYL